MSRFKIAYALLAVFLLAACQSANALPAGSASATVSTAEDVPRMRVPELKALLDAGEEVIIVDTRSLESYQARHITGALSMPLLEVDDRYQELPKDAKIVLYCT